LTSVVFTHFAMTAPAHNPWLHRFALLTAAATLALIGIGGLVTSHEAGMSVTDWPTSYGYNMFFFPISKWWHQGNIFYEHSHRLVASGVGLLTTILVLWLHGKTARPLMRWAGLALLVLAIAAGLMLPKRGTDGLVSGIAGLALFGASFVWPRCEPAAKWLRRLGLVAFFAVLLQGVLGGLRVLMLKDEIGIFHAALAQMFFVLTCALALFTSRWWQNLHSVVAACDRRSNSTATAAVTDPRCERGNLRRLVLLTTLLILGQLILGATMRHQHAGLAIPDFPLAYGKLWPAMDADSILRYNQHRIEVVAANPITAFQISLQMAHRLMAVAILGGVLACAWLSRRRLGAGSPLAKLALVWLGLVLIQVGMGAWTIWSDKAADITTAHVLVGAVSLVTGALWCLIAFHRSAPLPGAGPALAPLGAQRAESFGVRPALGAGR
jgi:cytochrome c oxidase assembly protein subunit 15